MSRGAIGVCTLIVLAILGVVVLAGATGTAAAAQPSDNASLGADISSFMQASSAEMTDEVDDETFNAAINRTDEDERQELIEQRQERLRERQQRLQTQREGLGNVSDVRNRSVAARIAVGASGLERSVNETERFAGDAGVDTDQLSEIRSSARGFRGPEVAELTRDFASPPGQRASGLSENSSSDNYSRVVGPSIDAQRNHAETVGPPTGAQDNQTGSDLPATPNRTEASGPSTDNGSTTPDRPDDVNRDVAAAHGESQRGGDRSSPPEGSASPGHTRGDKATSDNRTR